jgi:hypothetical protein
MGATSHTPGPWIDLDNGFGTARAIHAEKSGPALAFVHSYSGLITPRAEERDANARLIAAAPDLLEALYRLKTEAELDGMASRAGWDAWISMANAALAKAGAS